ncbi:DUF1471 domain-containing protein [Buttiauxella sp. B2]|uniref:DUF1471 family periplasmic protein YahO n=1 Tax=Buttiauxella sp. B2 TaxID=2587812 RepID=UPI00111F3EBF|nr:DUF1471 family periplasmic protein YahO [Buttiauxella sp. B2]TNV22661.1 DUF1471 domain-containing protein [Buttiauxella sp. B2]
MKTGYKILIAALGFMALNANATEMLKKVDFDKVKSEYVKIGSISTSNTTSQSDAKQDLLTQAEKKGADVIVLTSGNMKKKIHGTADMYKKK